MPAENLTFDAKLEKGRYLLTMDYNGGVDEDDGSTKCAIPYEYDVLLDFVDVVYGVVRTGYTLTGWNTKADGTGDTITVDTPMPPHELTMYAQWTPNQYDYEWKFSPRMNPVSTQSSLAA
jgi:uncharacterized repeat protein (TIGR02543 family)